MRLRPEPIKNRPLQRLVTLVDQRLLRAQDGVAECCCRISWQRLEGLPVELLDDAQLIHEGHISQCARSDTFERDGGGADAVD